MDTREGLVSKTSHGSTCLLLFEVVRGQGAGVTGGLLHCSDTDYPEAIYSRDETRRKPRNRQYRTKPTEKRKENEEL